MGSRTIVRGTEGTGGRRAGLVLGGHPIRAGEIDDPVAALPARLPSPASPELVPGVSTFRRGPQHHGPAALRAGRQRLVFHQLVRAGLIAPAHPVIAPSRIEMFRLDIGGIVKKWGN